MSFYKYSNVNQSSSQGWTAATLWTDDPTYVLSNSYIGQVLYINNIAIGKAFSRDVPALSPPLGYTLYSFNETRTGTLAGDLGINTGVDTQFVGIDVYTNLYYTTAVSKVEFKKNFNQLSNAAVAGGGTVAYLWSDDTSMLQAAKNSLNTKKLYINGNFVGTITANELFDGNISGANCDIPWYNGTTLAYKASAKGKSLMKITFQVDGALGTTLSLPQDIESVATVSTTQGDWLYATDNWIDGFKFYANEYGALYTPGHLSTDTGSLAQDNEVFWNPIKAGLLALWLNGKFIAPIVDARTGFGYQNEALFGQPLPVSYTANPWSPTRRVGFFMTSRLEKVVSFNEAITSVEFKPYYRVTTQGAGIRFSVAGPPNLAAYPTTSVPMISQVKGGNVGQVLYVNGIEVGTISAVGSTDLIVDGRGPLNFDGFTGSHSSPNFKEYYFDVAVPKTIPAITATMTVSLDNAGLDTSSLVDGTIILIGLPPIKEGVDGLIGQRLIVNEIYIGIVISNTLNSITTALAATVDLEHVPHEISGIWRLETTAPVGRVPLCVCSQISLSDYPEYPVLQLNDPHYNENIPYTASDINYFPNELDIYTRRDTTDMNALSERLIGHVFPAWCEHAHVDPTTQTFLLADTANTELDQPIISKYVGVLSVTALLSDVQFRKLWQYGTVSCIPYSAYINQGSSPYWNEFSNGYYQYQNIPGQLAGPSSSQASGTSSKGMDLFALTPLIVSSGIPLPAFTIVLTPTGTSTTDAAGHLTPGAEVLVIESTMSTSTEGKLPAGTVVITDTGRVTVGADGTLPPSTVVLTPMGSTLVDSLGLLQPGILVNTVGVTTVGADGTLNPGMVVLTPAGSIVVDLGTRLPPGLVIVTPTGTVTVDARGHLTPGTVVVDTILGTATVLPDGTLPVGTSVKIFTNGDTAPVVVLSKVQLCTCSVVETACAPHPIEVTCSVLEGSSFNTIEETIAIVEKAGAAITVTGSVLERVTLDISLTLRLNSVLSPEVSISTSVGTTVTPTKTGTTIKLKRGNKANLPVSAREGEALVTLDTCELFIGTGTGLRKVSDVIVSEDEPTVADRSKLWYKPSTNTTFVWKDAAWQATTSDSSMDYGAF